MVALTGFHSSNSIEKNRNKNRIIFYRILCILVTQNMWMLTFNVVLGYQGLLFRDLLWLFFRLFFFNSDRPTQYQETHSTLNGRRGWWPVFQPVQFVKCWQFFWSWILRLYQNSGKEKESRSFVFASSTKREIRYFHDVVVQRRQRNCTKKGWCTCKVVVLSI